MIRFSLIFITFLVLSKPAIASFQEEMDDMFGSMVNITNPDSYQDQRRGAYTGGTVVIKNPIANIDLISFQPPSIDGGCGGINVFGGSFSFIDADQFTQLLRNIASNAGSYAFKLALQALCPSCMATINEISQAIQKMNAELGNTCQMAQNLVDSTGLTAWSQARVKDKGQAAQWAINLNKYSDDFQAYGNNEKEKSNLGTLTPQEAKEARLTGNIAWVVLTEQKATGTKPIQWFAKGDDEFARTVMSITGTVIVEIPDNEKETAKVTPYIPTVGLTDIMGIESEKSNVELYKCIDDTTDCMSLKKETINSFETMREKVSKILHGNPDGAGVNAGGRGIVEKFTLNLSGGLSDVEKSFLQFMPEIGKRIRDLCLNNAGNPGAVKTYTGKALDSIALEMTERMFHEVLYAVRYAASQSDREEAKSFLAELDAVTRDFEKDADTIRKAIATDVNLTLLYTQLMASSPKLRLSQSITPVVTSNDPGPVGGAP